MQPDPPWATLRANGDARRIPVLLHELRDPRDAHRERTWQELVDLINHQGDVYDATVAALPALFANAAERATPVVEVLDFVSGLAENTHCRGDLGATLRRALSDGYPLFVAALRSKDDTEREVAAYILGNLAERTSDSLPELERMLAREQAPRPLAVAIWAFGTLQASPDPEVFATLARDVKSPLARAVANAFLARLHGREASESETRAITDALHHRLDDDSRLPFGFLESSLQSPLGDHLLQQIRSGRYTAVERGIEPTS
ncbi:MAG: hypothetical protein ACXVEE_42415 [Polyangiales bacterium]